MMRPKMLAFTKFKDRKLKPVIDSLGTGLPGKGRGSQGASWLQILLCSCLLAVAMPVHSVNFRFLDFSPVRHFGDEDWRLFREAGDDVIENKPDGARTSWENPRSGASGTITAVRTTKEADGTVCRLLRVENRAGGVSGQMNVTACKEPGEPWRLVSR